MFRFITFRVFSVRLRLSSVNNSYVYKFCTRVRRQCGATVEEPLETSSVSTRCYTFPVPKHISLLSQIGDPFLAHFLGENCLIHPVYPGKAFYQTLFKRTSPWSIIVNHKAKLKLDHGAYIIGEELLFGEP